MIRILPSLTKRKLLLLLLSICASGVQAADWVTVAADPLRDIDIDRGSIIDSDGGTRVAWGRIQLKEEQARRTGYASVRALNRYDCRNRSFSIVRRVYESAQGDVLREETIDRPLVTPVRPGTVDERFFNEVCPPPAKASTARQATELQRLKQLASEAGRRAAQANRRDEAGLTRLLATERGEEAKVTPAKLETKTSTAPIPESVLRQARNARTEPKLTPEVTARSAHAAIAPTPVHEHWSYEGATGPDAWGGMNPAWSSCRDGRRQSPIDIRDGIRVDQEALEFDYLTSFFRIVDNGHTIQINYGPGSTLGVMGRRYELQQFHFHKPSEERINGRAFDMVMHLVHKDSEGHLAAVAVLLQEGHPNPLIQQLWNNLPLERNQEYAPKQAIRISDILPEARGYYAYMGSLTTPPCTEGVLWLVLKQPVELSREQIAIFSRFYENNARPLQPTNGRIIKESR